MRDVFYTILVVWVLWRIMSSVSAVRSKQNPAPQNPSPKESVDQSSYSRGKKNFSDDEGEYVDFEEVK
jgi:hypothetical protein